MNTKPILFWPKPRSDIKRHLDREADDFLVVDTNSAYELQKLYKLRPETPIFDPFPHYGEHYRDFIVVASDCRYHIDPSRSDPDEHADEIISVPSQEIFDLNVREKVTFRYA